MKCMTYLAAVILTLGLSACDNKQEETPVPETAPAADAAPAPEAAVEPAKSSSGGGGYEPTEEERVPGVTIPQEEIDRQTAEALANTPKPEIPGEENKQE